MSVDFRQQFLVWLEVKFYMPATKAVEDLPELFGAQEHRSNISKIDFTQTSAKLFELYNHSNIITFLLI